MLLSIEKIIDYSKIFKYSFEKFGDELFMISVSLENENHEIPSYWRLFLNEDSPPLEIGVSLKSGNIISITCFVTCDDFKYINLNSMSISSGCILVNTTIFTKLNDYCDNYGNINVFIHNRNLYCLFNNNLTEYKVVISDKLGFIINNEEEMIGFILCDLSEMEINIVNSINV